MGTVTDWIVALMGRLGSPGAGLLVALESIFPPIPSELILPLAGFAASRGDLDLVGAVVWTTLGSLVGALVLYALGAKVGEDRLRAAARRIPLVKESDLDRVDDWFTRHGGKAVLLGRMVPGVRSLISIPAGVARMPVARFVLLTGVGSLVWNSLLISAGYVLGSRWGVVQTWVGRFQEVVIVLAVLLLVVVVVRRVRESRVAEHGRAEGDVAQDPPG
jgi:membrane protein DedA with SNARE-associated domain